MGDFRVGVTWETLYSWVSILYGEYDKTLTTHEILSRLLEEASELVSPILMIDKDRIQDQLPDILTWIVGLIIHLEEIYPNFSNRNANIIIEILEKYKDPKTALPLPEIIDVNSIQTRNSEMLEKLTAKSTITEWQDYFKMVYKNINKRLPPDFFMSQLLADLGMLAKYIRNKEDSKLVKRKIAAIIAWTFAIANKFNVNLEDRLLAKYREERLLVIEQNPDKYLRDFVTKYTSVLCAYPEDYERFESEINKNIILQDGSLNFIFVKIPEIIPDCILLPQLLSMILLHTKVYIVTDEITNNSNSKMSGIAFLLTLSLAKSVRIAKITYSQERKYLPNIIILTTNPRLKSELYSIYSQKTVETYLVSGVLELKVFPNERKIVEYLINEARNMPKSNRGTLLDYFYHPSKSK